MIQNSIAIKKKHQKFIEEVVLNGIVWGLKSDEGYATSSSNDYEDNQGEPIVLICFWSNKKLANVCGRKYWKEYKPQEIELTAFLENWCVGMYNENSMAGTNFDWNLFGQENDTLELALEIIDELKKKKKTLAFRKFECLQDFETQTRSVLDEHPDEN